MWDCCGCSDTAFRLHFEGLQCICHQHNRSITTVFFICGGDNKRKSVAQKRSKNAGHHDSCLLTLVVLFKWWMSNFDYYPLRWKVKGQGWQYLTPSDLSVILKQHISRTDSGLNEGLLSLICHTPVIHWAIQSGSVMAWKVQVMPQGHQVLMSKLHIKS